MSNSFRRRVRTGWRHCWRCCRGRRRGEHGNRRGDIRNADFGGVEEHHLVAAVPTVHSVRIRIKKSLSICCTRQSASHHREGRGSAGPFAIWYL